LHSRRSRSSKLTAFCSIPLNAEFLARGAEERTARTELRRANPRRVSLGVSLGAVKTWMADNKGEHQKLVNALSGAVGVH